MGCALIEAHEEQRASIQSDKPSILMSSYPNKGSAPVLTATSIHDIFSESQATCFNVLTESVCRKSFSRYRFRPRKDA